MLEENHNLYLVWKLVKHNPVDFLLFFLLVLVSFPADSSPLNGWDGGSSTEDGALLIEFENSSKSSSIASS